ncbi:hypothetical protein D3C86_1537310 [compost metagenome]
MQLFQALDMPVDILHQTDPGVVAAGPGLGDVAHQAPAQRLAGGKRQQQLEQGQGEQRPAPEQRVEHQQHAGNEAAARAGVGASLNPGEILPSAAARARRR